MTPEEHYRAAVEQERTERMAGHCDCQECADATKAVNHFLEKLNAANPPPPEPDLTDTEIAFADLYEAADDLAEAVHTFLAGSSSPQRVAALGDALARYELTILH